jgi:hypothetical protein
MLEVAYMVAERASEILKAEDKEMSRLKKYLCPTEYVFYSREPEM